MVRGKSVWIWLAVVVLTAAILPAVIFGEARSVQGQSGGDPWRNILYDFQTLITGFAAVGAAALTIRTMNKTEIAAQVRHEQMVALSLRADRLKVERMLQPQRNLLVKRLVEVEHLNAHIETWRSGGGGDVKALGRGVLAVARQIKEYTQRAQFRDAAPLFSGELNLSLLRLEAVSLWARNAASDIARTSESGDPLLDAYVAHFTTIRRVGLDLAETVDTIVEQLDEMAAEYRISL